MTLQHRASELNMRENEVQAERFDRDVNYT